MKHLFTSTRDRLIRLYQTGLLAMAAFLATNLDSIMATLGYLEGSLDNFVEQQEARINFNDTAARRSFQREDAAIVAERSLRSDLDNDSEDARAAIGKALTVRNRVRQITAG